MMRDICEIAGDIARDPSLTGTARATSMPYLDGLKCVRTSSDMFGMDNAGHIGGTDDRALANVAAALKIANASFALPVPSA